MVLALAFVHHLAIARNVPLDHIACWLTGLGRTGVIEFVPKSDPTVQQMLALREEIFPDYFLDCFAAAISRYARITESRTISQIGSESRRHLLMFERGQGRPGIPKV